MFSNYGTAMGTLFKGILMLAACSGCYLVWWGVAFYPERHVPLWLSGILLVATAACGIMAVNWMAQGIFQAEKVRAGIPGGWILAGGVIGYVVLLVISNIIFHRMVTTELFLIIGWAVLNLITVDTLYASGLFSAGVSVAFVVLTLVVVVAGRSAASTTTLLFLLDETEVDAPETASYFFCPVTALSKYPFNLT